MILIYIAIGGFFGAMTRFALQQWIQKKCSAHFPIDTLLINLVGSFLLGIIIGGNIGGIKGESLLGIGFMGAFTTYSTFSLDSILLWQTKQWKKFFLYIGISYGLGLLLAFLGLKIGGHYRL